MISKHISLCLPPRAYKSYHSKHSEIRNTSTGELCGNCVILYEYPSLDGTLARDEDVYEFIGEKDGTNIIRVRDDDSILEICV